MEMTCDNAPIVLTIDDDDEMNAVLQLRLRNTGCKVVTYTDPKEFLSQLKPIRPQLCIVDINVGAPGVGFKIVEVIRKVLGTTPPIILFSSENDLKAIAHGIDLGADDYLIKPSTKIELVDKVEHFLKPIHGIPKELKKGIPDRYKKIKIVTSLFIEEIDEFGIKVKSNELLSKGTVVLLKSSFFLLFSENYDTVLGTIISNWIHPQDRTCGAFIEFNSPDKYFMEKLRAWIIQNNLNMSIKF